MSRRNSPRGGLDGPSRTIIVEPALTPGAGALVAHDTLGSLAVEDPSFCQAARSQGLSFMGSQPEVPFGQRARMVGEVDVNAALIIESYRLLNRARMISETPAAQTSALGHTHPTGRMPPGLAFSKTGALTSGSLSTLQACGRRINQAIVHDSDTELQAANAWCASELKSLQHGSVIVPETEAEFSARIVRDYEGVSAPQVARAERSYVRRVRDARVKDGRDARMGHKLKGKGTSS